MLLSLAFPSLLPLVLACTGPDLPAQTTATTATTATDTATATPTTPTDTATTTTTPPVDDDGDGYARWDTALDPADADCDDADPAVTPLTERHVPAGTFVRGVDKGSDDSVPAREIYISDVCVDVTEVTNSAFLEFLEARAAAGAPNADDEGRELYDFDDDDDVYEERITEDAGAYAVEVGYEQHPVTEVFHWSGEALCDWLGKRLPTEAEWEKAARGASGDARQWPWGDINATCDHGNMLLEFTDTGAPLPCVGDTTPVGGYPKGASPYGMLDMAGNVAEWVADWYQADYYSKSPDTDPQGPESGEAEFPPDGTAEARVSRGGSYLTPAYQDTVSFRYAERAEGSSNGVGFRCARTL